ncbi:nucleoside hydrolase [Oceaniovalibus sp. ACAM 378]|uniref:nucleoside hydrolase n=1 Tax=Oceaniovalibus sp. ACAM 378 TaxID=2599923 RepID=UPI0011D63E9F|nr:nucleoside hydrolase [Oceaniovalibus sp. ACAM 378]TYB90150.1 nucleoside hydrolase [Oceaniovalibus sp. ACAM 378]
MTQLSDAERLRLLTPPTGKVRAVLDTDTYNEIDDQFAIVQMLLSPDKIDLEAIYAAPFHNHRSDNAGHGMELSFDEILRLLKRMDRSPDGFVHRGATRFMGPEKKIVASDAVTDMVARAKASTPEDPLYIVAIGAITNVASALLTAPEIIDRTVVVWLGGHALEWPHVREFNLKQDVGAAQVVLDSGVPMVLLPCMGVVSHLLSTVPEIEKYVEPHGEIGRFLAQRYKEYNDDHMGWSKEIWDMAPVAWLLDSSMCPSDLVATPVLTEIPTWSTDRSRHLMRYVHHIDRDAILKDFFRKIAAHAA